MFESLSQKLEAAFKTLRGHGKITEQNVTDSLREVRRALLDADVNLGVAKEFIEKVRKRAIGQEVLASVTPGQQIIKIIHDEMIRLLGETRADIAEAANPPTVILIAGLQGSGKTTFAVKLARLLRSKGRNPLLAAADVYRPAAVDQLKILAKQLDIPVYSEPGTDAVGIAERAVDFARSNARDTVIIDTAGRMHVDEAMMDEVARIREITRPHEILFVVDAMTGRMPSTRRKRFMTA
jgi:signal recognition particle subunit SRP54